MRKELRWVTYDCHVCGELQNECYEYDALFGKPDFMKEEICRTCWWERYTDQFYAEWEEEENGRNPDS